MDVSHLALTAAVNWGLTAAQIEKNSGSGSVPVSSRKTQCGCSHYGVESKCHVFNLSPDEYIFVT